MTPIPMKTKENAEHETKDRVFKTQDIIQAWLKYKKKIPGAEFWSDKEERLYRILYVVCFYGSKV